jgi:hypothetical protein
MFEKDENIVNSKNKNLEKISTTHASLATFKR